MTELDTDWTALGEVAPAPAASRPASSSIVIEPTRRELHPSKATRRDRRLQLTLSILVPLALFGLWQLAAEFNWIDVRFFPPPSEILSSWRGLAADGRYFDHLWASGKRIIYGYISGSAAGLVLGLIIGRLGLIRRALEPTIVALYTVPKLAILPLLLLVFGIDETPKILLIAITVFFVVVINTTGALEAVPAGHLEAGRSFGLNRAQSMVHIILPSAMPQIFIGLRLAAGVAVLALVGAEFVAAKAGLGFLIWNSWNIGIPTFMYIGIVSIAVLGVAANELLRFLQWLLVPWER